MRWALSLFVVALASPVSGQEPKAQEIRFHRVHLLNGNFVDGALLKQNDQEVVLKVKGGEMAIRLDLIARVEFIRMRSVREAPEEVPAVVKPKPPVETPDPFAGQPASRPAEPLPAPRVAAKPRPAAELYPAEADLKRRIDLLLGTLEAADVEQKSQIIQRLTEADPETAPYLASLLEEAERELFPDLVGALKVMRDPRALPVLLLQLESVRPEVRAAAAAILGSNGDATAARPMWSLLRDDAAEVRAAALLALRGLAAAELLPHLPLLCVDPEREVRARAIDAFFDLSRKQGTEGAMGLALSRVLAKSQGAATLHLIEAIGAYGKSELGSILAPYLGAETAGVRAAAAAALGSLGGAASAAALLAKLSEERDSLVRVELARSVQKLKTLKAAGPLIEWLEDPDGYVRGAALQALEALSGKSFGPSREKWAAWWEQSKPGE